VRRGGREAKDLTGKFTVNAHFLMGRGTSREEGGGDRVGLMEIERRAEGERVAMGKIMRKPGGRAAGS